MEAMIKNDDEKLWMSPLLELRNDLGDFSKDKLRRDFRRMNGRVQLFHDGVVRGPYSKAAREYWLRRVLQAQQEVRRLGPPEFRSLELISLAELHEIRRIWLYEKHEFQDSLPRIYREVTGQEFPKPAADDNLLRSEDWEILREVCQDDEEFFQLQTGLLDIEREFRGMARRVGDLRGAGRAPAGRPVRQRGRGVGHPAGGGAAARRRRSGRTRPTGRRCPRGSGRCLRRRCRCRVGQSGPGSRRMAWRDANQCLGTPMGEHTSGGPPGYGVHCPGSASRRHDSPQLEPDEDSAGNWTTPLHGSDSGLSRPEGAATYQPRAERSSGSCEARPGQGWRHRPKP